MYPKWVQRAPDIGAVLCLSEADEKKLLSDWADEQLEKEEAATKLVQAEADAAKEAAQIALKTAKK